MADEAVRDDTWAAEPFFQDVQEASEPQAGEDGRNMMGKGR